MVTSFSVAATLFWGHKIVDHVAVRLRNNRFLGWVSLGARVRATGALSGGQLSDLVRACPDRALSGTGLHIHRHRRTRTPRVEAQNGRRLYVCGRSSWLLAHRIGTSVRNDLGDTDVGHCVGMGR